MRLTEDEAKELKKQLSDQIGHLPPQQREAAQQQIDSMSPEALEEMLRQQRTQQPIFRMIVNKEVDSTLVAENSEAIAVLEINPLAKGHTLVIPKDKALKKDDLSTSIIDFATEIGEKIQKNLKPKKVNVKTEEKFGEAILEIVPEYDELIIDRRKKATKPELEEIKKMINTIILEKPKPERIRIKKKSMKRDQILKLRRRIP